MIQDLYPIQITKQKRKHIQLMCCPDFTILVKAPFHVSKKTIMDFVDSKRDWINKHMSLYKTAVHLVFPKPLVFGSPLYYLGRSFQLTLLTSSEHNVFFDDNRLVVCYSHVLDQAKLYLFLVKWYKAMAYSVFEDRIRYWQSLMNIDIAEFKIKQFKARWGSCSVNQVITLNWILIKAPIEVIDYVILHECCHVVHFNHSKRFWQLVQHYMPDYKDKKRWLKENGVFLLQNH
tara:strand:- start:14851 stop:15546 length:696 start_codon:yes stop_codon:yes gene_type:complete